MLKVKRGLSSLPSGSSNPTEFGELSLDTCFAEGVGFPEFQKVDDRQNAEPILGKLSRLAGQKTDQVRLSVDSDTPKDPDGWAGISGTALFVDDYLVAVATVTNQGNSENDNGEQEDGIRGLGQKVLWASPISLLCNDKEFCRLIFGRGDRCILRVLPVPKNHRISENDFINDVDVEEIYPPPISTDAFIKLLSDYSNSYNDEQMKLSILDNIALYAWNLIVERSSEAEIAVAVRAYIEDDDDDLSKLIKPLYFLSEKVDLTNSVLSDFFEVGILNGEFIPPDIPLEGYTRLLRRLIISLLYSHPHLVTDSSLSKRIEELLSRRTLFWVEFFADLFLRWKCGNIEVPNPQILSAIENSTNRYITAYPEKPIVMLWPVITLPLETAGLPKEDVLQLIRESARSCRRNIEFKWCISAATRILPLYDNYEDERTDQNFINSLFEEEFDKELALRSPQIQSIYLRGLLKNFLRTKDIEYLSNYETQFLHVCKNLPHPSRCHLQTEYVSCLYLCFQILSKEGKQDDFRQLRVGALLESERDLLKDPLFENHLLKYQKETFYSGRKRKQLSISNYKSIVYFLDGYIQAMYAQYAQRLIALNHLYVRDFPALAQIYHIRKDIASLILVSLQKSMMSSDLSYHYSFYARSTPMLSGIERHSHLDLIKSYVFKALKSDAYSVIRNAKDIVWGLYSYNYYAENKFSEDIQKASTEFAVIDGILTKEGKIDSDALPKVHWAYYAGIRWRESDAERKFVRDLYRTPVSGKVFQLNVKSYKDIGVKFPDEIFNVISKHSKKSVFAATLGMNFDSADVWNILGTTVYNNIKNTSETNSTELRKAARFYSMAKCFSRISKDHAQKYCYNYIRCNSLAINETGFEDRHNFFAADTARYLFYPNNRAKMFGYKLECLEPYLEMIQSSWSSLSKRTRKDVFRLLRVEWLELEFYKPKYESLLSSLRQVGK